MCEVTFRKRDLVTDQPSPRDSYGAKKQSLKNETFLRISSVTAGVDINMSCVKCNNISASVLSGQY